MAVNPSAFGPKPQFVDVAGNPAIGYQLFFYVAGSTSTKQNTYTDSTGVVANTNPIILNALGEPSTQIWWTAGQSYKAVLAPPTDTDPPTSPIWTIDNLYGINDFTNAPAQSEWVVSPLTPTFVNATTFTLTGNQTSDFQVGRRIRTVNNSGTIYSTISASVFAALTTVTVVNDSGVLDSGLAQVSYGLLSATNPSVPQIISAGANITVTYSAGRPTIAAPTIRNYIAGLTMSTAGGSATMSIAAGQAADSTNALLMTLAASISKTTSAWAVGSGNGGLDTGAIAINTWYHFYEIRRPDTGVVDIVFSTNATTPTLPASYTQYRRIGSGLTDGSSQWTKFLQFGDNFFWNPLPAVVGGAATTGASTNYVLPLPLGVRTLATLNVLFGTAAGAAGFYVHCPDITSQATSTTLSPLFSCIADDNGNTGAQVQVLSDLSSQVAARANTTDTIRFIVVSYTDDRGKNN